MFFPFRWLPRLAPVPALLVLGCARHEAPRPHPPAAELLIAAGDSTYWVTSDSVRLRLRAAPLFLTRVDGRFYELYVVDDDRSYYDAVLVGQRIFARDLLAPDSLTLLEDTLIAAAARRYAATHPLERPLSPDEDAADDPRSSATSDVTLLDVHGPYLSYEYHADLSLEGQPPSHNARRAVIDIRTGIEPSLRALFGDSAARALARDGARLLAAARDSIGGLEDDRARRATAWLAAARIDPRSYSVETLDGAPGVEFLVAVPGDSTGGMTLPLEALPVGPPQWWTTVRSALPSASDDSSDRWTRGALTLIARADSDDDGASLVLRDSSGGRWSLGHISAAPERVWWLDAPPLDSASRRALARAFDESVTSDEDARVVRRVAPSPARAWRLRAAGFRVAPAPRRRRSITR